MTKSNGRRRGLIHVNSFYFHHERMPGTELKAETPRRGLKQRPRRNPVCWLAQLGLLPKDHMLRSGPAPMD